MVLRIFVAAVSLVAAFCAVSASVSAQSVNVAPRQSAQPLPSRTLGQSTYTRSRDETGRSRTRIIVQRRSYLDAGTEVLPGERKYRDYVSTPGYSPTVAIDNTPFGRRSLNGPFDLPGQNNPFQQ
jgi:hypothetical protein